MEQIILISGKARSGKNATADILKKHFENNNKKVLIIAYGDYLKYICKNYFDWNGVKDERGRNILQQVGTDLVRNKKNMPNFWVNTVKDIIKITEERYDYFIIPDCRFVNEINEIKKSFKNKVVSIKVERIDFVNDLNKEQKQHESEVSLDNYNNFDYVIKSKTGIENLNKEIEKMLLKNNNISKPREIIPVKSKVKITNILNTNKAKHLLKYINETGYILNNHVIKNGIRRYKVLFDNGETAYFRYKELHIADDKEVI